MMSKVVRCVTRMCLFFILVYASYLILHGHLTPGGGFQGGAVFASGVILLVVAFGSQNIRSKLQERRLSILESTGALIFIGLAFAGIGTAFLYNFLVGSHVFGHIPSAGSNPGDIWTGGVIPLMNIAVGIKVLAGLSAIVLTMALGSGRPKEEQ